ncbi:hypothetical protein [Pandoraea terrigena]|uniref:Prolyl 4-hydroxylase alpha subunit Fe(2+) 2OG dioxygenase domain-containing protein n=1 Tax=Pandoraea terrigena TaxID=2508292 RepID=A0A5E4T7K8_9BURK|nr:hypothetical protein [Pandoraea terrigena]VVD82394.1 hypothetical protein PTE31013_01178 [Pandoraea terrigena]
MRPNSPQPHGQDRLTSYFWSGDAIRSRRVSDVVLSGNVDVPELPVPLLADWAREISLRMTLDAGDVEVMPLARARTRWPDYSQYVQAVSDWTRALGLPGPLAANDVALMACRGARYHHDGEQYGGAAFCNLFLSDDKGQDVHFPALGLRIPLKRGTVLIFDTCQPHGVIRRGNPVFDAGDFPADEDGTQVFLTWELPIEDPHVARALDVVFDVDPVASMTVNEEQVRREDARVGVCPQSGQWRRADASSQTMNNG